MAGVQDPLEEESIRLQFPQIDAEYAIEKIEESVCRVACPAGVNVKAYLGLIAAGKFEKALEVVKRNNPLPGICGRVCTHPCEAECRRGDIDEPIAICALKRFIADYELERAQKKTKPQAVQRTEEAEIAIIGSGPAGLTAANDLIRLGYGVTIFEALPVAGGMLSVGIPSYRLPREIIETEISAISDLGVKIKTDTKVEDIDGLLSRGFEAVFIATGAHVGLKLNIPGENEFKGVVDCTAFLKSVNLGSKSKPGRKVIVIGGGNSAIDSARTALRLGCEEVHIIYRRSRREMPAAESEVEEAEIEGVKIHYLVAPVKILGESGKVTGMECIKMRLGEPDSSGRRRPIPIEGTEFVISADFIIPAIGQKPDISFLSENHGFKISKWGTFEVNLDTQATNRPGFFAGGDTVTGPNTVIDAIAAGHRAAASIHRYLQKIDLGEREADVKELQLQVDDLAVQRQKRIKVPKLKPSTRRKNFEEVELSLTEEVAIKEAKRCLRCGPCLECVECVEDCNKKLVALSFVDAQMREQKILVRIPWAPDRLPLRDVSWDAFLCPEAEKRIPATAELVTCVVKEILCRGCGKCEEVCEYSAVQVLEKESGVLVATIDQSLCKGCGTCAAICPTGAIEARHFTDEQIESMMEALLAA